MTVLRRNRLREMIRKDQPTIGTRMISSWPGVMEVIGHSGTINYVEFVSEYGPYDLYSLDELARASELFDMSTMIKIDAEPRTFIAQRAIGSGIQNVLFADIRNAKDAEEAVRAVRAEPKGWNGCSMRRVSGYLLECGTPRFVQYCEEAIVALMIEKKNAIEKLEEILSVKGIDMVQFGPCDYSMSIGLPGQTTHHKVKEAEIKMIKAAQKYNIRPRAEINSIDQAQKYIDLGVRDFNLSTDLVIIYQWLKKNGEGLREILEKI
ncbi:MAG: HpcH/HpaI aldolase/citrate lyase family protein [Candidatus Hodarchaeota archaeon]